MPDAPPPPTGMAQAVPWRNDALLLYVVRRNSTWASCRAAFFTPPVQRCVERPTCLREVSCLYGLKKSPQDFWLLAKQPQSLRRLREQLILFSFRHLLPANGHNCLFPFVDCHVLSA